MRNFFFAGVIFFICLLFASYNIYISQDVFKMSNLALASVEALANDEIDDVEDLDGGELAGGGITCSKGSSGRCFKMTYQEGLYGVCFFYCEMTGYQTDYCSSIYVGFVNFCTAVSGV